MTQHAPNEFAQVLTRAVQHRNLTLERLSSRLKAQGTPVSIATLSYWQSGRSLPTRARSLKALEHLETILEVRPGHLVSALPGDSFRRWDPKGVLPLQEKVQLILDDMGLDLNRHMRTLQLHDSLHLNADRTLQVQTSRHLVRAEDDELVHVPAVFSQFDPDDGTPLLSSGHGCVIGQMKVVEEDQLVAGELVFPRSLNRGDLHLYEYQVLWQYDRPGDSAARSLPAAAEFLVLDARFDGEPPAQAAYFYAPCQNTPREEWVRRELEPSPHLQVALADAPAGLHHLTWRMAGQPPTRAEDL
ncbi:hypothetical protein [Luteococcus peritonei]|uniref:XRE family transcriptional regulator n=1 Tax=Luteococcus peritonei TaxID=88874 RepID=A0ABW4RQQ2_9ACTN